MITRLMKSIVQERTETECNAYIMIYSRLGSMSDDNTEEATWTSSRANAIKEQLEIESNKIMLPNADGTGQHQDTTKVPVHSAGSQWDL